MMVPEKHYIPTTVKSGIGNHHGVTAMVEVCSIILFFCEQVTDINNTWNVGDFNDAEMMRLVHLVFFQVDIFSAFVIERCRPINTGLVITVNGNIMCSIEHPEVHCEMSVVLKFCYAFVHGDDFCLTGTEDSIVLSDRFPPYWSSLFAYDKSQICFKI